MKKIMIVILTSIFIYLGATFYTGIQIKKNFDDSVIKLNQDLHIQGLDLRVVEYKRGFFSSYIEMNLGPVIPSFSNKDEKVGLNTETKLYHGPILLIHDIGLGQYSSITKLIPKTKYGEFNAEYTKVFGDSIGKLFVSSHFGGTYIAKWKMDPVSLNEQAEKFTIDKSFLTLKGDLKTNRVTGDFSWGAMHMDFNKGEHIEFNSSAITSSFDFTKIDQAYMVGKFDLAITDILFKKNSVPVSVKKVALTTESKVVGKGLDTKFKLSVGEASGPEAPDNPLAAKNIYYNFELNQIDIAALKHFNEVQQKMVKESGNSPSPQAAVMSLMQVLPEFLQPGLNFKLGFGATYKEENIKFSLDTRYHPLPKGMTLAELNSPNDYLMLVDADLLVSIPKSLDKNNAFASLVGTRLKETEKEYVIDAKLRDAQFTMGNEEVPLDQLMGQLMSAFKQFKGGEPEANESMDSMEPMPESTPDEMTEQ